MEFSTFNIIQYSLIAALIVFGIYYFYTEFFGRSYEPLIWKDLLQKGKIDKELFKASRKYPDKDRFFNFWFQVERLKQSKIKGAFAELGVYKGQTANILHLMDTEREFYLFDTFEGFTEKDLKDETGKAASYTTHNFADTSIEQVSKLLKSPKFVFHQGYFPKTTENIECDKELILNSYPGALIQVLTHLLMNSFNHGFANKTHGVVNIHVFDDVEVIRIIYEDNGRGISEDNIDKIFDPFFTTSRGDGSSGLGMHIVYTLTTQKLNGTIRYVKPEVDGVKFEICINK